METPEALRRWTSIGLLAVLAVFGSGCGVAESEGSIAVGAAQGQQPAVTPEVTQQFVPPSPSVWGTDVLPNGDEIPCAIVEANVDDLPPTLIDHRHDIEQDRSRIVWWAQLDEPQFSPASGQDLNKAEYLLDVDGAETELTSPQEVSPLPSSVHAGSGILQAHRLNQAGLLVGINEIPRVDAVLIPSIDGTWTPLRRCGGYSPLVPIVEGLQAAGLPNDLASANRVFLELLGYPPLQGITDPIVLEQLLSRLSPPDEDHDPVGMSWQDLDPSNRVLADAPDHVRQELHEFVLVIDLPESWIGQTDALICTRVPDLGWNPCLSLDAMTLETYQSVGAMPLDGMRKPGSAIQIVLLNAQGDLSGDSKTIGTLDPETLEQSATINVALQSDELPGTTLRTETVVGFTADANDS